MTISKTLDDIFIHPYWKEAITQFINGEPKDLKILLIDFATHIYEQTSNENAVAYRSNKNYSPTEIYKSIKNCQPPQLAFWLKRTAVIEPEDCKVIVFSEAVRKVTVIKIKRDPCQLYINFPDFVLKQIEA